MKKSTKHANSNLNQARINKNNEFYTSYNNIADEILLSENYQGCFQNKTVLCNCNDIRKSGFLRFFAANFKMLCIRELIIVSYGENATVMVYDGSHAVCYPLRGDGDFSSEEGIKIVQHADIICTNPPFSLFRPFIHMLVDNNKDFLVVGNTNEALCLDIFPLIQNGTVRFGSSMIRVFHTPEGERKFGNVGWYTNIGSSNEQGPMKLASYYTGHESDYPKFDNYDAISVKHVRDIPCDYSGEMGVPGGYLLKHDPEQFELIGTSGMLSGPVELRDGTIREHPGRFYLDGERLYDRVVIKRR